MAKKKNIIKSILWRFINPAHLYHIIRLQRNKKKHKRVEDDAQLALYAQILKGDFLHYGYFENPAINPQDVSMNDIYTAQHRYAENIVALMENTTLPVLDVGCGMGGLLPLIEAKGAAPEALTPDATQVKYITKKYPHIKLHHCRFEDINITGNEKKFGTIITSESLQYLKLEEALPLLSTLLAEGGTWIACDYFRTGNKAEKSGHYWDAFSQTITAHGWELTYQQDITPNILPTIAYVYMWATQIGMPLYTFAKEKIHTKNPGIYYALQDALPEIDGKIQKNIDTINPKLFAGNKKYVLMVLKKKN